MTTNYLIATWSGRRRNPSTDFLKAQFRQLRKLKHRLDEITVIIPKGSDDPDYYDVPAEYANTWLRRPENDRSYGQFLFACRQLPRADFYFLVEDDYLPVCDNFDSTLIGFLNFREVDYLCGSFGPVPGGTVSVPRHNVGVIRGDALRRIAELNPKFLPNGEGDGQEQEAFGNACKEAGVKIGDWSDTWEVPYFDRYLRYFSERFGGNNSIGQPIFSPYQLVEKKALGYHNEENEDHFLSTMEFETVGDIVNVNDQGTHRGWFKLKQTDSTVFAALFIDADYHRLVRERIQYECRGRKVIFS